MQINWATYMLRMIKVALNLLFVTQKYERILQWFMEIEWLMSVGFLISVTALF